MESLNICVSVIMPVHNRFDLVNESIKSAYAQTHRPIELIIVDDLSDEPFIPKIDSDENFDVKIIWHDQNKGPGAARETGRLAATADYIAYLDSDDLWHPEKLEKQVAMLNIYPNAGMCYCSSSQFSSLPLTGTEPIRKRSMQQYSDFLPTILSGRPWDTSACLWTRTASELIGSWFEGWAWEDYEYDFRAGCKNIQICFLPEIFCYYRVEHGGSQLSRTERKTQLQRKTKSLLKMNESFHEFKDHLDQLTKEQFLRTLYYQAMHLFYIGEKSDGLMVLDLVKETLPLQQKLPTSLISYISPFASSKTLGDILYKFRMHGTLVDNES